MRLQKQLLNGLRGTSAVLSDVEKAALQTFISSWGYALGALPVATILDIISHGYAIERVTLATYQRLAYDNPQHIMPWPFNAAFITDPAMLVFLYLLNRSGTAKMPTGANGIGYNFFVGGSYGNYVSPALAEPDTGNSDQPLEELYLPGINFRYNFMTAENTAQIYTGGETITVSGQAVFIQRMAPKYLQLFADLFNRGMVQVMNYRWNVSSPDNNFPGYRDSKLITFEPRYGLVTPLSNFIQPVIKDESLMDIVKFVSIVFAGYAAVSALGTLTAGEAIAQPTLEEVADQVTQEAAQKSAEQLAEQSSSALSTTADVAVTPEVSITAYEAPPLNEVALSAPDVSYMSVDAATLPGATSAVGAGSVTSGASSLATSLLPKAASVLLPAIIKATQSKPTNLAPIPATHPPIIAGSIGQSTQSSLLLPLIAGAAVLLLATRNK